jgi:hypothetical protein
MPRTSWNACRCLQSDKLPGNDLAGALHAALHSDAPQEARNAALALGALSLCGPLCPLPTEEIADELLSMLEDESSSPAACSGAAIAAAAAVEALDGLDDARVQRAADALLVPVSRSSGGMDHVGAAAAALTALGHLSASCLASQNALYGSQAVKEAFALAVFTLTTLCSELEPVLQRALAPLPDGQWVPVRTSAIEQTLEALQSVSAVETAPLAYAAVAALASIIAAAQDDAEAFSALMPLVLRACCDRVSDAQPGGALYGTLVGATVQLPAIVSATIQAGLPQNAAAIRHLELPDKVMQAAPDACVHAAALCAKAAMDAPGAAEELQTDMPAAKRRLHALLQDISSNATQCSALPRARFAQACAANACACIVGCAARSVGTLRQRAAAPATALLLEAPPDAADVCKVALTHLERACLEGKAGKGGECLLAVCCKVRSKLPRNGTCCDLHFWRPFFPLRR